MARHRTQLMIDEDLYQAFKQNLPRGVSVSDIVNTLLKAAIQEVKMGRQMTDKEFDEWIRKDPERMRVRLYLQDKLGPYIDVLDGVMSKFRAEGKKGKK